jgi:hypothetical protein
MNGDGIAKHYDRLAPEERFRLILAAGARGDGAEQGRLRRAGRTITLSMPEHAPHAHAFDELARLCFIELLEEAARYREAFTDTDDADSFADGGSEGQDDEGDGPGAEGAPADGGHRTRPLSERRLDLILVAGFVLRTKAEGWKLFCERMAVPPFALWEPLPGFERFQRALALTEFATFAPEEVLRWLNDIRPEGASEVTEVRLTAERVADEAASMFHERVTWWGG